MNDKIAKIALLTSVTVLIAVLIFILLWKNNVFVLKAVRIYNNRYVSKDEILDRAKFNFSENIFKISTKKIEQQIRQHPMVEKVTVSRFFPSVLKIKVKEKGVIASIVGSELAAVTDKGDLIFNFNPEAIYDLPVITGLFFHTDSMGNRRPQKPELMRQAFRMLKAVKKKDPLMFSEISELHFNNNIGLMFNLKKNNILVLFGENHLVKKMNYFSSIFKEQWIKNSLNNILAIDIRYEGQVVIKQK